MKKGVFIGLCLLIAMGLVLLSSCADIRAKICIPQPPSPGSITYDRINDYSDRTKSLLNYNDNTAFLTVGHAAGNYTRYPMFPRKIIDCHLPPADNCTWDINRSIDRSFDQFALSGVEVDVQMAGDEIYIIHEKVLPADLSAYLQRNTLKQVLIHFGQNIKYMSSNKMIYIEIKCEDSEVLEENEKRLIKKVVEIISDSEKKYPGISKHIAFVSFNYSALQTVHDLGSSSETYFILATNKCAGTILKKLLCHDLSTLNDTLIAELERTSFLSGIWFDPYGIPDFSEVLSRINAQRRNANHLVPLQFFISTYKLHSDEYFSNLSEQKEKLQNVVGLIFDLNP
jgi:hypothetical protein